LFILASGVGTFFLLASSQAAFIPTFYLILVQCTLGLRIFLQNWRDEVKISFSVLIFLLALWSFCAYQVTHRVEIGLTWVDKFILMVGAFLVTFFLYFSLVFPKRRLAFRQWLIFIFPFFISFLVLINLVIKDVVIKGRIILPIYGGAYYLYVVFILLYAVLGLYNLTRQYFLSSGVEKLQVRYVLFGLFLTLFFLIVTNLLLPWFGEARLAPFGQFFTLFL